MRFTERELTIAVRAAAQAAYAATQGRRARRDPEAAWQALTPYERYRRLEPVSTQVLPVLIALPDVEVAPGTAPAFTAAQVTAAVEETLEDPGGRMRRKVVIAARVALVGTALAALPPREDPDSFVVPDHL